MCRQGWFTSTDRVHLTHDRMKPANPRNASMRVLSKSKLMAYRQCPKRLWLEVHRPDLRQDSAEAQASFAQGHRVGEIARLLYDPAGKGALIDVRTDRIDAAIRHTRSLLRTAQPIFEAGFMAQGGLAFADVMLPIRRGGTLTWRMVEVKSTTIVKPHHLDDVAVQYHIARASGVPIAQVAIAHLNSSWIYPGRGDFAGLLLEEDQTLDVQRRSDEVRNWISEAQRIVARKRAPARPTGKHCTDPYACGFLEHCQSREARAEHPIAWLPGKLTGDATALVKKNQITELRDIPDDMLNDRQRRVRKATLAGKPFFDRHAAAEALACHRLPGYFLDFETVQFPVPRWEGTRPYQQIPFQFSLHRLSRTLTIRHTAFLDLSGSDPSKSLAESLIDACGSRGPIFVYNARFEKSCVNELMQRFRRMAKPLQALHDRMVDLFPIARDHYYHPSQQGSWSLKPVLRALCPDLDYGQLDGVRDGQMAMDAYIEALAPETRTERRTEIERQLLAYCERDTFALVMIWATFTGTRARFRLAQAS